MKKFPFRKWNNILHRDIGYLIFGLTIVYGISGIAVNHIQDWNPNYSKEEEIFSISPITQIATTDEILKESLHKLNIAETPTNYFRPDSFTIQIFFDEKEYSIDLPTGNVFLEKTHERKVLYEMNQLHLNSPKGIWTFIADLYAGCLIFIAITGLFVLKGKTGITGRGAYLTIIGVLIPIIYWIYYLYF